MKTQNEKIRDAVETIRRMLSEGEGLAAELDADTYDIRLDYDNLANLKDLYNLFANEEISDSLI